MLNSNKTGLLDTNYFYPGYNLSGIIGLLLMIALY